MWPPPKWETLEFPAGFHVPLPRVLAYKTTELAINYVASFLEEFYTDWAAHVAAYWSWERYYSCSLWYLPKFVFLLLWDFSGGLTVLLGGQDNFGVLRAWFDLLKRINFEEPSDMPYEWNRRSQQEDRTDLCMKDRFLGCTHSVATSYSSTCSIVFV